MYVFYMHHMDTRKLDEKQKQHINLCRDKVLAKKCMMRGYMCDGFGASMGGMGASMGGFMASMVPPLPPMDGVYGASMGDGRAPTLLLMKVRHDMKMPNWRQWGR
jgi:hypothetical protein